MSALDSILVVVDAGMQQTAALQRGVELARKANAMLHLCIFDHEVLIERTADLVHPDVMRLAKKEFLDIRMQWLTAQAAARADRGLRVECHAVWAPLLHEAVLAKVLELEPGMVVKDTQRESLLERLLFTPADWKLLRACPVPAMFVHADSPRLPHRVLAAVDTSVTNGARPLNEQVLRQAFQIALYANAELHLAHVFPYTPLHSAPYRRLETVYAEVKKADEDAFLAFARAHHVPDDRRHLAEGEPAPTLNRLARRISADMIVVGSVYRSAPDRFFMGSTAEALLTQAGCDVLLVKPDAFMDDLRKHVDLDSVRRRYGVESSRAA